MYFFNRLLPFNITVISKIFLNIGVFILQFLRGKVFHSSFLLSMAMPQCTYSFTFFDGHLHCFQWLAITNECAMNFHINYLYVHYAFSYLGSISRNGIAELYDRLVYGIFVVLRNCEIASQNGCNILQFHQ